MSNVLKCISPIDGSVLATREAMHLDDAKNAISKATTAQRNWKMRSLSDRVAIVRKAVQLLGEMNDEIVPELAWQMGRPVRYGGEFGGVLERSDRMAELAADALSPIIVEQSEQFERYINREPHGLVLVIAPWNYPYMTAINTVAPALIAGNAVMLKHATQTMLVGERLQSAFTNAGLPEGVFQNMFLDHDTTSTLIAENAFQFVNFTGSVQAGRKIESAAAGTFTGIGLELGGKDPGYVMDDANMDVAVETLIDGAMFNSGQCCCGIERIYVVESRFDEFVEKSVDIVSKYTLGNPLEEDTTLGPMAQIRFAEHVRSQTNEACEQGAKRLINSALFPADSGAYLMPQILVDVNHSMRVMNEESFGPVVGIMKVKNDEEAVRLMNDSVYGLTASLWTVDTERAARLGDSIDTGTVFMNRCDYLDPSLCWTGCKDTGRGGGLSVIGYHNLTRPKSFHLKKSV